jgi:signal transduction histidine kinase
MQPPRFHPLTLEFTGEWKPVEEQYRESVHRQSLGWLRAAVVILALLFGLFSFLDHGIDPSNCDDFLVIRFAVVTPAVLLFLGATTAKWFQRVQQPLTALLVVLGAAGIMLMIAAGNRPVQTLYQSGLLLAVTALFLFLGVRFFWALAGWALILTGFLTVNYLFTEASSYETALNTFMFLSVSVVCIIAGRRMELSGRTGFALRWGLTMEKAMVSASNRSLEARIDDRTRELVHANQVLREEMARIEGLNREKGRLEARLRQSERMETVGRLAGGIAHDFNNLLTVVIGNANMAGRARPGSVEAARCLDDVIRAAEKAAGLTRQLLAFGSRQVISPEPVELNRALKELEGMIRGVLGEAVDLIWKLHPKEGTVLVDPGQLEQVVINLVMNARDAVSREGTVTLGTAFEAPPEDMVRGEEPPPAGFMEFFVADDGAGMDQATAQRIFEPYFTTKGENGGTGLGLSTAYGIARQHGGFITVDSSPGQGSVFRVYLPLTLLHVNGSDKKPFRDLEPGGGETVLLVEDDDLVRAVGEKTLSALGYRVLSASGGREALELSRSHPGRIHLLLVDVVMPIIGGRTLAEELKQDRPDMKILFTSGYSEDAISSHGVLEAGLHFLPKPYGAAELAAKIRSVLEEDR